MKIHGDPLVIRNREVVPTFWGLKLDTWRGICIALFWAILLFGSSFVDWLIPVEQPTTADQRICESFGTCRETQP